MSTKNRCYSILPFLFILLLPSLCQAAEQQAIGENQKQPTIAIPEDMEKAMSKEAVRVKEELKRHARSLFERTDLGWDLKTIDYLYRRALGLPQELPRFLHHVREESRILGVAGSLMMLTFILALFYSLLGQKRVLARVEKAAQPLREKLPQAFAPFVFSAIEVLVAALIPLLLLGAFSLINAMTGYEAAWFQLTGRLLILWALAALVIGLLRGSLTRGLFPTTSQYGRKIFRLTRLALLYVLVGVGVVWGAEAFQIRKDVLALLSFVISISIVGVLFSLFIHKKGLLSLLPALPYRSYKEFVKLLSRYYYPLLFLSFIIALLWCIGYKQLGRVVLVKIWASIGAFLLIMLIYHMVREWLQKWVQKTDPSDETAQFLHRSFKIVLLYATAIATVIIIFNFLGLLDPLQRLMSFPVMKIGDTQVTLWIILKALLILLAFVFASRLLQAYLDYKVYPSIGIDPGLGYALNTFFKYFSIAVGFLISLKIVGINLRFLLVFAGAAGIGIGLGLQNMAANMISGFTIIFGGKIRKGDWIEVGGTLGVVTDIYLRATKVRTRDNIEYLIPNADLISNTIVNFSLSSPMIRIALPVGVSYNADPEQVRRILLAVAEKEPLVSNHKKACVRFVGYGDSSINFDLLIWIDVRTTPRRKVRSALYFAIFEELKKAEIEIPFPQRDIHIRTSVAQQPL